MKMNSQGTIFGAAILLFVVGAVTTLYTEDNFMANKYLTIFNHEKLWSLSDCSDFAFQLSNIDNAYQRPESLLNQLRKLVQTTDLHKKFQTRYAEKLITYADRGNHGDVCYGIDAIEFVSMRGICIKVKSFERFAYYLLRYAINRFNACSLKILNENNDRELDHLLSQLNNLFKAGFRVVNKELSYEKMYKLARGADLATDQLDARAMATVASQLDTSIKPSLSGLLHFLSNLCAGYKNVAFPKAAIVNLALAMKAISENELTYRFLLINEYVLFCTRYLSDGSTRKIKAGFQEKWSKLEE